MSELRLTGNSSAIADIIRQEGIKYDAVTKVAKLDAEVFDKTLEASDLTREQFDKVIGHTIDTLGALSLVHGESSISACKADKDVEWTSTEFELGSGVRLDAQYTRQKEFLNPQTGQKEPHYGVMVSGIHIEGAANKKGLLNNIRKHIKSASKEAFGT